MESKEEVDLKRWHRLITVCLDVKRGTLWWIKEHCWQAGLRNYDRNSSRNAHPGLSIREKPPAHPYEMIPFLHGTSGQQGPVVVRGLSADKDNDYPTSFGHLSPAELGVDDFRTHGIEANRHKPKLMKDELTKLNSWLKERGLA